MPARAELYFLTETAVRKEGDPFWGILDHIVLSFSFTGFIMFRKMGSSSSL